MASAAFVPDGTRLNQQKIMALVNMWKLEPPSIMLSCDAGTVHPKTFASTLLVKTAAFDQFWKDAMKHATRAGYKEEKECEEFALEVINDVILLKLVTLFSNILDACVTANWWLVIDRTSSKSPAAELLIELAMAQTGARPTILCIDSTSRLADNFCGENGDASVVPTAQACLDRLEKVKAIGLPLGSDDALGQEVINQVRAGARCTRSVHAPTPRPRARPPSRPPALAPSRSSTPWTTSSTPTTTTTSHCHGGRKRRTSEMTAPSPIASSGNTTTCRHATPPVRAPPSGAVHGPSAWPPCARASAAARPALPTAPNPPRPLPTAIHRPPTAIPHRPRSTPPFAHAQTFPGCGTHYIVLENANDAPDLTCLGGTGYVAANGQLLMYERLKTRIQSGCKIVMLHNTGGVVQAFASLRKAMLSVFPPPEPSQLLKLMEVGRQPHAPPPRVCAMRLVRRRCECARCALCAVRRAQPGCAVWRARMHAARLARAVDEAIRAARDPHDEGAAPEGADAAQDHMRRRRHHEGHLRGVRGRPRPHAPPRPQLLGSCWRHPMRRLIASVRAGWRTSLVCQCALYADMLLRRLWWRRARAGVGRCGVAVRAHRVEAAHDPHPERRQVREVRGRDPALPVRAGRGHDGDDGLLLDGAGGPRPWRRRGGGGGRGGRGGRSGRRHRGRQDRPRLGDDFHADRRDVCGHSAHQGAPSREVGDVLDGSEPGGRPDL